jgi:hypothetical protein
MGEAGLGTRVCDAGALIAIERGDQRVRALLRVARRHVVPAAVLGQVWRDGARQARLARFLAAAGTVVEPLDEVGAKAVGRVLSRSGTWDIVDGFVVVCARRYQSLVLSSDPDDLLRLDPGVEVERV